MSETIPIFAVKPLRAPLADGIWLGRNWHLISTPIWSRDKAATLDVSATVFPDPVPLVIELCVFDARPDRPRTLTVSSPGHPDRRITVRGATPVTVLSATPVQTDGTDHAAVTLSLETITSPLKAGLSADDRLLGLHIRSVRADPDVLSLPLNLGNHDVARAVLREGWSTVEPGAGVWSLAEHATLVLPGYLHRQDGAILCLTADVLPRGETTAPLHAQVFCNGVPAATWRFPPDQPGNLRCHLPAGHDNTDCTITLHLKNLLSPRELGINKDPRTLGLMLREIRLEEAPEDQA